MRKSNSCFTNALMLLAVLLCTVNQFRLTFHFGFLLDEYAGAFSLLFGSNAWNYLNWGCLVLHVLLCIAMVCRLLSSIISRKDNK